MSLIPKVIAEIGCVHGGSLQRAKDLAKLAKLCEADYVKTQKRDPILSTKPETRDQPHPNPHVAFGATYLEHRINLELTIDQHAELKAYCENIGITYSSSVWDTISAREIISLDPEFIKVPSACNSNQELMKILRDEYARDVHISLGMTSSDERPGIFEFWKKHAKRVVFYHCTSAYPCPFDKLYLKEIDQISFNIKPYGFRMGFSNHGYGIAADIAAMVLGAEWIERHFVDDRAYPHTDAAASLEPDGLRKLCRDLKNVHKALDYRPLELDSIEVEQRNKLRVP